VVQSVLSAAVLAMQPKARLTRHATLPDQSVAGSVTRPKVRQMQLAVQPVPWVAQSALLVEVWATRLKAQPMQREEPLARWVVV
jgi:hypothetical protein